MNVRNGKTILALVAVLGVVVWGGWAVAEGHAGRAMPPMHGTNQGGHAEMAALIEELNLNDVQQQHMAQMHDLLAQRMMQAHHGHGMHLAALTAYIENGALTHDAVRTLVDEHVAELRRVGYQLGDSLVTVLESLDAQQREVLHEHLAHAAAHLQEGELE